MTTNEIILSHGDDNEATATPYWAIVRKVAFGCEAIMAGIWFNRADAEAHLERRRYAYGKKAYVFCFSGYYSEHLKKIYANARASV